MLKQSINSIAKRDGISPRTAQRHRKKLNIGEWMPGGKNGIWLVNRKEWQTILKSISDGTDAVK